MIDILYFGLLCDEMTYNLRQKQKAPYFVAQYLYEQALSKELNKHSDLLIEYVTIYQTDYFPKDKLYFRRSYKDTRPFRILSFLNLPLLKELSYFLQTSVRIIKWFSINRKNQNKKCIYVSLNFPPVSSAVIFWARCLKIKRILTITDLPSFTFHEDRIKEMKLYKRVFLKPYIELTNFVQNKFSAYILFSPYMVDFINIDNKPFCVVEGIYNTDDIMLMSNKGKDNAIAHAGTLSRRVGVQMVLNVFDKLNINYSLWLLGGGDMEEEIKQREEANMNIHYFGYLPRNKVFEHLMKARLLLILRNSNDEYTYNSFPSKLFEYMLSGTPVFVSTLKGIPDEYYDYVFTLDTNDEDIIAREIERILSLPEQYLHDFGNSARQFILEKKNPRIQVEKIINVLYLTLKTP